MSIQGMNMNYKMHKLNYEQKKQIYYKLKHLLHAGNDPDIDTFASILRESLDQGYTLDFAPRKKSSQPLLNEAFYAISNVQLLEYIKVLIEAGADVNQVDEDGRNCLMKIVMRYTSVSVRIIEEIIRHTTDINAQDKFGWTALFYACGEYLVEMYSYGNLHVEPKNNLPVIRTLLKAGADPNIDMEAVIEHAEHRIRNKRNMEILRNECCTLNKYILSFVEQKNMQSSFQETAYEYEL